jgi:hypothetical protein
MNDKIGTASFDFIINGHHGSLAFIGSVPRIIVYVLAPQTIRAMVSVAVSRYFLPAVFALKIFYFSLKLGCSKIHTETIFSNNRLKNRFLQKQYNMLVSG